jgi:ABC-type amino acid transport substrate-binding protein
MYYSSSLNANRRVSAIIPRTVVLLVVSLLLATASIAQAAATHTAAANPAGTLERIKQTGKIKIGYAPDAQPFSYSDTSGKVSGYAITLCNKVADAVKADLGLANLAVDFVPLTGDDRFRAVEQGKIDLLCGAAPTLARRATLDFSIPVFASGTGVVVRSDAPARLVQVLSGAESPDQPYWRGMLNQAPERKAFAALGGTTVERALIDRLKLLHISVDVVPVKSLQEGLQLVQDRRAAAFFGDRAMLLAAARSSPSSTDFVVIDRIFRREPFALALQRNDADFRLLVDRSLSRLFRSGEIGQIYTMYFGAPGQSTLNFFELSALQE